MGPLSGGLYALLAASTIRRKGARSVPSRRTAASDPARDPLRHRLESDLRGRQGARPGRPCAVASREGRHGIDDVGLFALLFGPGSGPPTALCIPEVNEVEVAIAPKVGEHFPSTSRRWVSRFKDLLDEIISTPSVVRPPEICSRLDQGLGMALFEAVHAQNIALALQREFGGNPDSIRFALFVEATEHCTRWSPAAATWSAISAR